MASGRARDPNYHRAYYRANRARWVASDLARKYGLTIAERDAMAAEGCQACGSHAGLVVDHDHVSGVVRGILCGPCNRTAGHAQDDPDRLRAVARYLETWWDQ